MKLSEKLLQVRKSKNLSQTDVAKEVGVTRQSISSYERGNSTPDAIQFIKLAKAFNMTLDELAKDVEVK